MQGSEKLCLKWNDFQQNINSTIRGLKSDTDFADVTLVCDDGTQFEAHKFILASSSPFFRGVLKDTKLQHPLIYMRGVSLEDMATLLDFLYFGEANVSHDGVESYLALAEDLKIEGLRSDQEPTEAKIPSKSSKKLIQTEKDQNGSLWNPNQIQSQKSVKEEKSTCLSIASDTDTVTVEIELLDTQVMMTRIIVFIILMMTIIINFIVIIFMLFYDDAQVRSR